MVEIIGVVTVCALLWVQAWSMARESDSERRRTHLPHKGDGSIDVTPARTRPRQAA
ncbi:MAG TPA: hypothetical protein PKA61_09890 [Nitrospira sp.]|nr:hypothetical protein [Nitrospira sp.]